MGSSGPVLHVLVVGFHHKKGNQVEYSYPTLIPGKPVENNEVPDLWKHLPSLALPDGAHNYKKDTVYFHLPSKDEGSKKTVYGVSCYRQIDANELINRGADVTRNSVQKSVCVLSTLPLYGLIEAKLELITHAYFKERDFSEVSLLQDTFTNLNLSLSESLLLGSQVFLGLSCRDVVNIFRNRILVLFKMMLLERRILFYSSPVKPTVNLMLTVMSLFPGMIEQGLVESAAYSPQRQLSPTMKMTRAHSNDDTSEEFLEVHYTGANAVNNQPTIAIKANTKSSSEGLAETKNHTDETNKVIREQPKPGQDPSIDQITHVKAIQGPVTEPSEDILGSTPTKNTNDPLAQVKDITSRERVQSASEELHGQELEKGLPDAGTVAKMEEMIEEEDACFSWEDDKLLLEIDSEPDTEQPGKNTLNASAFKDSKKTTGDGEDSREASSTVDKKDAAGSSQNTSTAGPLTPEKIGSKIKDKFSSLWQGQVENGMELQEMRPVSPTTLLLDDSGFPLSVFTKGVLCHPYLCLQYYDLLSDVNVRGFVIGATNALFKQKKHMIDVIVELTEADGRPDGRIEINDPELRKQLSLSTADLRFADAIAKAVIADPDDTEWEGGDEWIRAQFKTYLMSLLATAKQGDETSAQDFNSNFISAWKTTHNYKVWKSADHGSFKGINAGHPCQGQIGVGDVKLKLAHTMQNTEKGKKINAALGTTGRAVVQTGKAVGGAFNIAKKSVSSWITSIKDWNQQPETAPTNEESTDVQKPPASA